MCSRCMGNNSWKNDETGDCKICGIGLTRMKSWTAAFYKNPLREFLEWLINGLGYDRTLRTYAISHYGGFAYLYYFIRNILVAMTCICY